MRPKDAPKRNELGKRHRPERGPKKLPLWAWHLHHWIKGGRKGPRPADAPKRTPIWFWKEHYWHIPAAHRAHRKHVKHWKKAGEATGNRHHRTTRKRIVKHWRWGATARVSPKIGYTEDDHRDDWLVAKDPCELPQETDCSGWVTEGYYVADAPDPNGLAYRYLGYTGTLLEEAYKHGHVFTDLRQAVEGDDIVMGEGTGVHTFGVVKADPVGGNPWVSTHGAPGVQIIRALDDPRTPKRVCRTLPTNEHQ